MESIALTEDADLRAKLAEARAGAGPGHDVVQAIEALGSRDGSTAQPVVIAECGQLKRKPKAS